MTYRRTLRNPLPWLVAGLPVAIATSIASCGRAPDPLAGLPTLPFDQSGAVAFDLARTPARLTLPEGNLAPGTTVGDKFPIASFAAAGGGGKVWKAELPFKSKQPNGRYAPAGMKVFVGDREIPFDTNFSGADGWRVQDGQLHVLLDRQPSAGEVQVEYGKLRKQLDRLEVARSGLAADAFVRYERVAEKTRTGLLLPAPASAEWDLQVPAGGVFRAHVSLIEPPMLTSDTDGAEVAVVVVADGEAHDAGTLRVPPPTVESAAMEVDLGPWAGKDVTVRLETRPGTTAVHDYVFVAAPVIEGAPTAMPRRVVVLGVDTLRPDHLSHYGYERKTSLEIDEWAGRSVVFETAWSPAPRTRPSFRTATTGRWPLEAVGAKNIGAVFDEAGFATAGMVANVHLNPRFRFHDGFDLWWLDTEAKADDQVDRALAWMEENRRRDTYLFLHVMDPHLAYVAPRPYRDRFVVEADPDLPNFFNRWQVKNWQRRGKLTDRRKEHIEALYDGEIAWTSAQIDRLLEGLAGLGGNTLVVFHTDHGEEFWEHGGFEHNHTLYDEVVRAALWFDVPGSDEGRRIAIPASLADIAPTLYDYAGVDAPPPTDGISLRPWIDGKDREAGFDATPATERPLPVGYFRYDREQWGVVYQGHKYILTTEDGREQLYDLKADPGEQKDLSAEADLAPYRVALAKAHTIPVGPGWRVNLRVEPGSGPITLTLPEPCLDAGIIEPESLVKKPVNQEWGEVPPKFATDVGKVTLSDDKRTITFAPGRDPSGQIYVLFREEVLPGGVAVARDGKPLPLVPAGTTRGIWHEGGEQLSFEAGTVVVPPLDEAARMAIVAEGGGDATKSDLELLEALGYIGGEEH